MSVSRRHARRHGFTLIELILSMGIVAMISASLYAAMRTAFKARASAEAQVVGMRPAAVILDLIQADFDSIVPPGPTSAATVLSSGFVGYSLGSAAEAADSVTFFALGRGGQLNPTSVDPLADGIRQVEFVLQTTGGKRALVRRVRRNILATTTAEPVDEVLARNVKSFAVRYFDGSHWTTGWDSLSLNNALPTAVNIEVVLNEPTLRDPTKPYRMTRLIPIPTGVTTKTTATTTASGAPTTP